MIMYDGVTPLTPPAGLPRITYRDMLYGRESWWRCRYCGKGESGIVLTARAEAARATGHEATCPERT